MKRHLIVVLALVAIGCIGLVATGEVTSGDKAPPIIQQRVLRVSAEQLVVASGGAGTNGFGGAKVYDFPDGRILVHGCMMDLTMSFADLTNGPGIDVALGTAVVTDGDLTDATDKDLCAAVGVDPYTNLTSAIQSALASSAQFDGTATAKDMYINMNIDAADQPDTGSFTGTVSGSITLTYTELGDF